MPKGFSKAKSKSTITCTDFECMDPSDEKWIALCNSVSTQLNGNLGIFILLLIETKQKGTEHKSWIAAFPCMPDGREVKIQFAPIRSTHLSPYKRYSEMMENMSELTKIAGEELKQATIQGKVPILSYNP